MHGWQYSTLGALDTKMVRKKKRKKKIGNIQNGIDFTNFICFLFTLGNGFWWKRLSQQQSERQAVCVCVCIRDRYPKSIAGLVVRSYGPKSKRQKLTKHAER